jgi:erythromycin esterase-like protein
MESRVAPARLQDAIIPLDHTAVEHRAFLELVGDAPIVLIGEATHGTHEFYRTRAELTKRLIVEKGFNAVCIEGDWPDAYRVNRYVHGAAGDAEAVDALGGFKRFPTWMWRNAEVLDFVSWLREFDDGCLAAGRPKAGFYGLDLYSMYASIDAVLAYLDRIDPKAAARARRHYACLDPFERHPERYGYALFAGLHPSCRADVLDALNAILHNAATYARRDGAVAEDEYFFAEQNARIVANAERYYGAMLDDAASTWNMRDAHMVDTLERLMHHLSLRRPGTKAVVWAHNSHVGDARATSMSLRGETNIGAIARARYGAGCVSIGFTTYSGSVAAASDWHQPEERKTVLPARRDSYEYALHQLGQPQFMLPLRPYRPYLDGLPVRARERAIGVVYRPDTELQSHYFTAQLLLQFDAIYHFDRTRAVEPLERSELWQEGELPEAYPTGE